MSSFGLEPLAYGTDNLFDRHVSSVKRGYRRLRRSLAKQYDVAWNDPDIQVADVDLAGDRRLVLNHNVVNRVLLDEGDTGRVLQHLADLWGYDVVLREVDEPAGVVLREHKAAAQSPFGVG